MSPTQSSVFCRQHRITDYSELDSYVSQLLDQTQDLPSRRTSLLPPMDAPLHPAGLLPMLDHYCRQATNQHIKTQLQSIIQFVQQIGPEVPEPTLVWATEETDQGSPGETVLPASTWVPVSGIFPQITRTPGVREGPAQETTGREVRRHAAVRRASLEVPAETTVGARPTPSPRLKKRHNR